MIIRCVRGACPAVTLASRPAAAAAAAPSWPRLCSIVVDAAASPDASEHGTRRRRRRVFVSSRARSSPEFRRARPSDLLSLRRAPETVTVPGWECGGTTTTTHEEPPDLLVRRPWKGGWGSFRGAREVSRPDAALFLRGDARKVTSRCRLGNGDTATQRIHAVSFVLRPVNYRYRDRGRQRDKSIVLLQSINMSRGFCHRGLFVSLPISSCYV